MHKNLLHLTYRFQKLLRLSLCIISMLLLNTAFSQAQNFTGNYQFGSITSGSGGLTDPTPVPTATGLTFGPFSAAGTGTATNPNASGRFSFVNWPTGASQGSTTYTGSINTSEYFSVTLTPASGYTISLSSITFTVQRSSTGPRQYVVRSSVDGFASNLPATSVSSTNGGITVKTGNVFEIDDVVAANAGNPLNGSTITLGTDFTNIPSTAPVTFHIYAYNAEATTGSFGVDNVLFTGSATISTGPVDATPPVTTANYPKTDNITTTSVDFTNNLNEAGTTYYEVLASAATAPSNTQVKAGQDATGTAVTLSGSFAVAASTDALKTITGLTASTAYKIYAVSQDDAGNIQTAISTNTVTTLTPTDVTPPVTAANYPKTGNLTATSVDLTNNLNEAGTTYYVVLPSATGTAPSAAQVKAGQDATGTAVTLSGSFAIAAANTDATKTISGLIASTAYNIYTISQDAAANLQTAVSTSAVTTLAPALANVSGYPKTANIAATSVDLLSDLNVSGTTYYVVLPTAATAPTVAQVIAGQDGSGAAASKAGSFAVTANTAATTTITGLSPSTGYKVYSISNNTAGTQQTTLSTLNITTAIQYFATYNFNSVTPTVGTTPGSGTTDPTPVPTAAGITFGSFAAVGVSAQPNAAGRFSFTNWPGTSISGNDDPSSFTGVLDPTKFYYEVTITPQTGNTLTLTSINFTVQRSGTGIRQYAVRSSLDNFASNLPASVDPTSSLSTPINNVFQILDANTSATTGSIITLGNTFANLTSGTPVTFRFYGLNSEANTGTFSIDDVNISGSATAVIPPADVTPPLNAAGYPKANNITNTTIDLVSNLNETGTTYYVLIPTGGTAPTTAAQIMAGTDGAGNAALKAGTINVAAANTDASATINGLTLATAYKIYVVSKDAAATPNVQAAFATVQATTTGDTPKTDQHITLAATAIATYGAADIDPGATSDNATIPVIYTSNDLTVATIVANKIHILKAGTVNITATQAGDATHDPAAAQIQVLTIQPKAITVIAAAATKIYGAADPAFTYTTGTSLVGSDAFTGSLTRVTGEAVNAYAITQGTLALNSNYTITYTGANLTITPKALTVTADNQTKVYSTANPTFTVTYTGFVNGDTPSSLTTTASATSAATTASVPGMYDIIPAGASSNNYTFNYVNGKLTVVSNSRTLTFNSLPVKTYGDADFDASATLSSGELPVYSTSDANVATIVNGKVHIVGAGNVTITATAPTNPDYGTTQPISQQLIVNKANQTINFASIPNLLSGSTYSLSNVISSSGLPVTFTVDDPFIANVQGTTLNALTIGTATVIASVAANANYNAANASQQVKVTNVYGDELVVHQAVSPNGDGINDFLFIEGIQDHPVNKVTIVNGTGIKVFEVNNYSNTNSNSVFNGRSNVNGKQQLAGTYFYLIELNDGGKLNRKTGYFLLKY